MGEKQSSQGRINVANLNQQLPLERLRARRSKKATFVFEEATELNSNNARHNIPIVKRGKQLEMTGVSGWGGKRKRAGRKNLSQTVNHMKREAFDAKKPLQITVKVVDGLPNLRTKKMHEAFKKALVLAKACGLRVLQYSLEKNQAHLFVECDSNAILGSAMKSFGSSFGKAVRKVAGGVGSVFKGRYHLSVLINPTKVRNSLRYVLLNRFQHEHTPMDSNEFSSWRYFANRPELLNRRRSAARPDKFDLPDYLCAPRSWLATKGWMRAPVSITNTLPSASSAISARFKARLDRFSSQPKLSL